MRGFTLVSLEEAREDPVKLMPSEKIRYIFDSLGEDKRATAWPVACHVQATSYLLIVMWLSYPFIFISQPSAPNRERFLVGLTEKRGMFEGAHSGFTRRRQTTRRS